MLEYFKGNLSFTMDSLDIINTITDEVLSFPEIKRYFELFKEDDDVNDDDNLSKFVLSDRNFSIFELIKSKKLEIIEDNGVVSEQFFRVRKHIGVALRKDINSDNSIFIFIGASGKDILDFYSLFDKSIQKVNENFICSRKSIDFMNTNEEVFSIFESNLSGLTNYKCKPSDKPDVINMVITGKTQDITEFYPNVSEIMMIKGIAPFDSENNKNFETKIQISNGYKFTVNIPKKVKEFFDSSNELMSAVNTFIEKFYIKK